MTIALSEQDDLTLPDDPVPEQASQRQLSHVIRIITREPLAFVSAIIIAIFIFVAIFAPLIAPNPEQGLGKTNASALLLEPSSQYPLGTDHLGRDILSRIIMGARPALIVPIAVVGAAVLIGAPLGAIAGYFGGWVDEVIMRITDMFLAFPTLLLAMAIAASLGRGLEYAALALVVTWWPWYTRLARGVAAGLRKRYFIEAARAVGVPDLVIIARHILPNTISPILVQGTIDLGTVILAMAGLAFIGLGTQPPAPDWGLMVSEGRSFLLNQWWLATFPGIAIFIVVLAFNLIGDTLRDVFDPRQYQ